MRRRNAEGSVSARALRAVFTGIGLSYLSVLTVSLWLSARQDTPLFVMLYAVVVYAGQGAGWYVAWALQRRGWLLLVSFAWYFAALLLGFSLMDHERFVLTTALSLLLLMGAPGLAMCRSRAEPGAETARSKTS